MRTFITQATFLCITLLITCLSDAQIIAFPGAEGAGKFTTGGRGTSATPTTVFEVTNLTDVNSPGSLRYACSQSTSTYPNRTIVFRVSGTIHLNSKLGIPQNTTIAGQTAPGDGICLADYPVSISGNNVIVRYIRVRMGDKNQLKTSPAGCGVPVAPFSASCTPVDGSGGDDAFGDLGHKNIIIDHCSISWSTDEAFTFYRGDSLTLQWNFIEEPLNYSYHFEAGDADFEHHGYGAIWGSRHGTFHHNLFAHCQSRNPRFGGNTTYGGDIESADFRNNVIYDWGLYTVYGGEGGQYNLVNNYYKYGPSTGSNTRYRIVNVDSNAAYGYAQYFLSGNYVDGSPANTANNWSGAFMISGKASDSVLSKQTTPFLGTYPQVPSQSATDAYEDVLNNAGALLPRRDTLDRRIVNDVRFRTGRTIDVQGHYPHATPYAQTVNAWPTLNSTTAPVDSDHDGMPDEWETANGSNPNDAADRQTVVTNGYTNLENYLNGISNTSPEVYFLGALNIFSQNGITSSSVQTITVSGVRLTGNVTLTAPTGYEISINNGTSWSNSSSPIVLTQSSGNLASTTVSIRLNSAADGPYNGYLVATTTGAQNFYFALNGNRNNVQVANDAVATWPLSSNPDPVVNGAISATSQTLGAGLAGISYNNTFGGIANWQRVATTSNLPVGYSANSYIEYTVTPTDGKTFVDTSIVVGALGGGTGTARMAIYYSKDGFVTSNSIGAITYNGTTYTNTTDNTNSVSLLTTGTTSLTGQQIAKASTNIMVQPGETLSIRVYPWITGSGSRYFANQNMIISGYITSGSTLPLKLIQFSSALENRKVRLLWQTTNEVNTVRFVVESSDDAIHFISIDSVAAKNNTLNNEYAFTDPKILDGIRYYRLKMYGNDAKFTYSNVVIVNASKTTGLSIFPNPATRNIIVTYPSVNHKRTLQLFASDGRLLKTIALVAATTQTSIDVSSLPAGTYFVKLTEGKQIMSFIKQ